MLKSSGETSFTFYIFHQLVTNQYAFGMKHFDKRYITILKFTTKRHFQIKIAINFVNYHFVFKIRVKVR
jgi:hypothetical protein